LIKKLNKKYDPNIVFDQGFLFDYLACVDDIDDAQ